MDHWTWMPEIRSIFLSLIWEEISTNVDSCWVWNKHAYWNKRSCWNILNKQEICLLKSLIEAKIRTLKWAYFILKTKSVIFSTFWSKISIWIKVLYEIRACCLEKCLKIIQDAGMFIPYSRVGNFLLITK